MRKDREYILDISPEVAQIKNRRRKGDSIPRLARLGMSLLESTGGVEAPQKQVTKIKSGGFFGRFFQTEEEETTLPTSLRPLSDY